MADVTGIVLTGGRSSRMGRDKAAVVLGGATLLERAVAAVDAVADEVVLVRSPGQSLPLVRTSGSLTVVSDPVQGVGPLEGLATGLGAATSPVALVVGVDHPFLRPSLLRLLVERVRGGVRWVIPELEGQLQPMCSALSVDLRRELVAALARGERSPLAVARAVGAEPLPEATWRAEDPEGVSFRDVDTPEALEAARQHLDHGG